MSQFPGLNFIKSMGELLKSGHMKGECLTSSICGNKNYAIVEGKALDKMRRKKLLEGRDEGYTFRIFFCHPNISGLKITTTDKQFENVNCQLLMKDENVLVLEAKEEQFFHKARIRHFRKDVCMSLGRNYEECYIICMYGNNQHFINFLLNVCADQGSRKKIIEAAIQIFLPKYY